MVEHYNRQNGYEEDSDVIYGDTDSVMVNFRVASTKRAMELGQEAANYVSATFIKPIKLEFEKVRPLRSTGRTASYAVSYPACRMPRSWARRLLTASAVLHPAQGSLSWVQLKPWHLAC